jgi:hypothetical protein
MENPFALSQAIDNAADGSDDGTECGGEDRGYPLVGEFDGGVVKPPNQGHDYDGYDGTEV